MPEYCNVPELQLFVLYFTPGLRTRGHWCRKDTKNCIIVQVYNTRVVWRMYTAILHYKPALNRSLTDFLASLSSFMARAAIATRGATYTEHTHTQCMDGDDADATNGTHTHRHCVCMLMKNIVSAYLSRCDGVITSNEMMVVVCVEQES